MEDFTVWILPLILAFTLHEVGHAYAAYWCGDRTAYQDGRLSLNPFRHLDPVGSLLLPGIGILMGGFIFGWAKPVPYRILPTPHWRRDSLLVALAGPFVNLLLMIASLGLVYAVPYVPDVASLWLWRDAGNSAHLNATLFVLNMLPVPGFDGGRVLRAVLPGRIGTAFEQYAHLGPMIFILLFLVAPFAMRSAHIPYDPFAILVALPGEMLEDGASHMLGLDR